MLGTDDRTGPWNDDNMHCSGRPSCVFQALAVAHYIVLAFSEVDPGPPPPVEQVA